MSKFLSAFIMALVAGLLMFAGVFSVFVGILSFTLWETPRFDLNLLQFFGRFAVASSFVTALLWAIGSVIE
jgi:hypothetical protein